MNDVADEIDAIKRILSLLEAMPVPGSRRVLQYVLDHQSMRVAEFQAEQQKAAAVAGSCSKPTAPPSPPPQ